MLKESKNKIIAVFQQNIDALKKEIKGIDEKYKKLAEEEKKELKEMLEYWKTQRNALNEGKGLVVIPAVEEQTETSGTEETEEEKIKDTIFPENNDDKETEEATEEVEESEEEQEEEMPVEEDWVDEQEKSVTGQTEEPVVSEEDDWPEFPEEWK